MADGYDFKKLLELPVGHATDLPEFLGPVQVVWVRGKGRGLVAARDVVAGELLFVNRAFAVAEPKNLVETTARKLEHPGRCSEEEFQHFFLLCGKGPTPEQLPKLTCRTCGDQVDQPGDLPLRSVDRRIVKEILAANAHELDTSDVARSQSTKPVSSLFLVASLVNHSCRPTTARVFLADLMFVRAARDLKSGEEITDGYISVLQPVLERRSKILQRYGFQLHEDRGLVEEALLPEAQVLSILQRIDDAESLEEFQSISDGILSLVQQSLLHLVDESVAADVKNAAQRLGVGLERLLFGGAGAMPVLVATAALLDQMARPKEAADAYCRCCWLMEELAPHNAYHAKWALEALICASRGGLPLPNYVAYARKVLTFHIGPGALETVLRRQLGDKRGSALLDCADPGHLRMWPPNKVGLTYQHRQLQSSASFDLQLHLDETVSISEIEISANQMLVYVRLPRMCLYLVLPGNVLDGLPAEPVRLSMRGRKIQASFHLQPKSVNH